MAHMKRHQVPKNWPVYRKGTKYVVRSNSNPEKGVPILVVLRDMLKIAKNRKEVKKALNSKHILLNKKIVKDEKNPALLFDVVTIVPSKKDYRIVFSEKGKFKVEEAKDGNQKVAKIVNKKTLKGKKTQLNLSDGKNFLSDIKCKVNDSALVDFNERKVKQCLEFKEKQKVVVFAGKHIGRYGVIEEIKPERKMVKLDIDGKKVNVLIKQIMVVN